MERMRRDDEGERRKRRALLVLFLCLFSICLGELLGFLAFPSTGSGSGSAATAPAEPGRTTRPVPQHSFEPPALSGRRIRVAPPKPVPTVSGEPALTVILGSRLPTTKGRLPMPNIGVPAAPHVVSVIRDGASPTNATSVSWTVTFSGPVQGVDAGDFRLAVTGLGDGAALRSVSHGPGGLHAVFVVTAATGSGEGTLGLDVVDDDTIVDGAGTALGGSGGGNGAFQGDVYAVDHVAPPVPVIASAPSDPSTDASPTFSFADPAADLAGFECRLDGGAFRACTSPFALAGLATGAHLIEVRAVDRVGNASSAAVVRWRLEAAAGADASTRAGGTSSPPTAGLPYVIAGTVSPDLYPGAVAPISLTFTSPNGDGTAEGTMVSRLTVSITAVSGGGVGPNPCTAADFSLVQIPAGAYPFRVPFGSSSLASLIGATYLPRLRMLNRQDTVPGDDTGNQDGCKGATVHLSFSGAS